MLYEVYHFCRLLGKPLEFDVANLEIAEEMFRFVI